MSAFQPCRGGGAQSRQVEQKSGQPLIDQNVQIFIVGVVDGAADQNTQRFIVSLESRIQT